MTPELGYPRNAAPEWPEVSDPLLTDLTPFGANTYREFAQMLANSTEESEVRDPWVTKMWRSPATVVSTTLKEPLDWPDATVVSGAAVDVVAGLKEESDVPLRSHGSSMNRALMAAGLVDHVQVTLFPVITGQTGLLASRQIARTTRRVALHARPCLPRTLDDAVQVVP